MEDTLDECVKSSQIGALMASFQPGSPKAVEPPEAAGPPEHAPGFSPAELTTRFEEIEAKAISVAGAIENLDKDVKNQVVQVEAMGLPSES